MNTGIVGIAAYSRDAMKPRHPRADEPDARITVAATGFLAEGGDLCDAFPEATLLRTLGSVSDVVIDYFRSRDVVAVPGRGRPKDASRTR